MMRINAPQSSPSKKDKRLGPKKIGKVNRTRKTSARRGDKATANFADVIEPELSPHAMDILCIPTTPLRSLLSIVESGWGNGRRREENSFMLWSFFFHFPLGNVLSFCSPSARLVKGKISHNFSVFRCIWIIKLSICCCWFDGWSSQHQMPPHYSIRVNCVVVECFFAYSPQSWLWHDFLRASLLTKVTFM